MFLQKSDVVDFDWRFLDTGLVYRYRGDYNSVKFKRLCPGALDALLEVYKALPLPGDMSIASIRTGEITGDRRYMERFYSDSY